MCSEVLCLSEKTYCRYNTTANKLKFSGKGLNRRILEKNGEGPRENYCKVLDERVKITSRNRSFRTKDHTVES